MDPLRQPPARNGVIEPADLSWRDGQPYSAKFADIYHARDGTAEVERVFLAPAGFDGLLRERRQVLAGELGFGTALNFAVIARRCLAAGVRLHFISFEAAPLASDTFREIAARRQAAEPVYRALTDVYPPLLHGWHRRRLFDGQVTLSVFWGDADRGLTELADAQRQPVDLWLLDGFAPDRNPEMWTPALFAKIASTAAEGTRVTTFTAAGRVRRGLAEQGFGMRRIDQQPHKRESLAGSFQRAGLSRIAAPAAVKVVGAGIAGASAARELANSGVTVEVVESAADIAAGASGIPVTVMHPRLHHDGSPAATLKATAYAHALAAVRPYLGSEASGIRATGALQIPSTTYPLERLTAVAERYAGSGLNVTLVSAAEANRLSGIGSQLGALDTPALWFPDACLVDTPSLTRALLDHPLIRLQTNLALSDWPDAPTILACGFAAQAFPGAEYLELGVVHGQLDLVRVQDSPLAGLQVPVVGNGYVAPAPFQAATQAATHAGHQLPLLAAGATYEYTPWPEAAASASNHTHVQRLSAGAWETGACYKAPRCVSSDRNPLIGPLFDLAQQPAVGKLVTTGHGSMGTVTSHLGAALLDAHLHGDVEPLTEPLRALVSPLRFRTRQARRGYRFGASA